ncbi:MAG: DNA starvation/stationary phase protection protein [Verrucomicrobia bacterium]|nr:DNA starvation/stationary phase protection protein [Verrucomicrobiota bacterium]
MKTATAASTQTDPVAQSLAKLLANTYALLAQTQLAHWNVEGPDFFALHEAFQKQYESLFEAVDEIAERIRALGHYAEGGVERFAAASDLSPMPAGRQPAKDFVAQLIDGHEKVSASAKAVEDASAKAEDLETQDLAIKRRQEHEKTLWMLHAVLK